MAHLLPCENKHELCLFGRLLGNIICGQIRYENDGHFCMQDERIRHNPFQNALHKTLCIQTCKHTKALMLSYSHHQFPWSTLGTPGTMTPLLANIICSFNNNAPNGKAFSSWLLPSFSLDLRTPGSFWMLVTRCSDKVSP